jgi:hypothetical protein
MSMVGTRISGSVKGTNLLTAVKALRTSRDQARRVLPESLHHYLDDRILVSSWYPESDLLGLLRALGAMLPAAPDPFAFMGRHTAREHLSGIYRNHIRGSELERTLSSAAALWRNYHDTGDMSAEEEAPRRWILRLDGFAAPSREFCRLLAGYFRELAEVAGAKQVEVTKLTCCLDGAADCRWRLSWA